VPVAGFGPSLHHHLSELGLRLRPLGPDAWAVRSPHTRDGTSSNGSLVLEAERTDGPWPATAEAEIQAACALMHLYGLREGQGPRRLGLDLTAHIRAVVAGQAALAALLARVRTSRTSHVTVSPAAAVLLAIGHYLAIADADLDTYTPRGGAGKPPPLRTRDGHLVEVETLRPDRWGALWTLLGADGYSIGRGWREHSARQWTARCRLPDELHRAVAAHTLDELHAAARATGTAVAQLSPGGRWTPCARPWSVTAPTDPDVPGGARSTSQEVPDDLPLSGVTVVECTRFLQGPYAGRVLAMLGARVLLIELPGGDPARGIEPVVDGCFAGFRALHRGKQPVRLDLARPAGLRDLHDLLRQADVFLHNWPAGRAERLGLTPADLWRRHPHLICAHASGWAPTTGPDLPAVASDYSAQAHSGLAHAGRPADEEPAGSVMTVLDPVGGLVCAEGILAALLRREITGVPTAVDTSLLSTARMLLPRERPPSGPLFHPLATADGHLALRDTPQTRTALGLTADADRDMFAKTLITDSTAHWTAHLAAHDAPCTAVRSVRDLLSEPCWAPCLARDHGVYVTPPWRFR